MNDTSLLLEIGAIMLIAFIGAAIAYKFKQSAILGYIIVGVLVGPFMYISFGDFTYTGLVHDTTFISQLSQIGLILLIFFVGLEFSMDKIRRVKGPAVLLSVIDVGINLFIGFLLAVGLGWPLIDSIFLAAVVAMSCSAVAMKSLMELGRLEKPETDYILGMVVLEEFISMIFLTVVGGLVIKIAPDFTVWQMVGGMAAFFIFFVIMAILVIPRIVNKLAKMKSDEQFVLFMLGVVLLSAAFAHICGVPSLIGAFFIGMVFAETKVMERMELKIAPLRDAFVAIFFVSFGMLIDPAMFSEIWLVVVIAVVMIILAEQVFMSFIAYLVGFNRRAATTIGAAFTARGGESVMYASIGSQVAGATKGAELNPIAGAITFVMSALCPFFIRKSYAMADWMATRMPESIRYGGAIFSRTVGKLVFPAAFRPFSVSKKFLAVLISYVAAIITTAATGGFEHYVAFAFTVIIICVAWFLLVRQLHDVVRRVDYSNLGVSTGSSEKLTHYVATTITLALVMCALIALMFPLLWQTVFVIVAGYLAWMVYMMKMLYHHSSTGSKFIKAQRDAFHTGYVGTVERKSFDPSLLSVAQEMEYRERER